MDVNSNNKVGSRFTRQWPEIKHIFQSSSLEQCLDKGSLVLVSEKLDGSNVALTSHHIVASRRNILSNKTSREELEKSKFSGVTLGKLSEYFVCLDTLKETFQALFPFLTIEAIVYGELIQEGTATSKTDKFNYRKKGFEPGDLVLFGSGVSFREDLNSDLLNTAISHLRSHNFNVILNQFDDTGRSHFVLLMNDKLEQTLKSCGFSKISKYTPMSLHQMIDTYLPKLLKSEIEGIVVNFGTEIVKWKGIDESYPDMFVEQIARLKDSLDSSIHTALLQVALESNKLRSLKKKESVDVLIEKAYVSALSKMRNVDEILIDCDKDKVGEMRNQFQTDLLAEMMNDCRGNAEFERRLPAFIKQKVN